MRFTGKPLRFLKQVVTMLFSANGDEFADLHPELVRFVLDRRTRGLPPEYKFELVLVRGRFARLSGLYGIANLNNGRTELASEVAHYPFALQMILGDPPRLRRGAIEHFADFATDETREVWLYTVAGHVETKFPGDYRSAERVRREAGEG
ncbi:MAG: hypothetical protein IPI67_26800 [Myxococcales bacterium]|nr:hypothetical protein [Myxococcales bacterium]